MTPFTAPHLPKMQPHSRLRVNSTLQPRGVLEGLGKLLLAMLIIAAVAVLVGPLLDKAMANIADMHLRASDGVPYFLEEIGR